VVRRAAGTPTQVMVVVEMTRLRMTGRRAPVATIGEVVAAVARTATEAAVVAV